jgi:outer membrane protein TolC
MRRTLILAVLLFTPRVAAAQPAQPAVPLTLSEAIEAGLTHSHQLAELQARVDAAGFVVDERRAADRPDVSLLGGYTRTNHVEAFVIPTTIGRPPQVVYPDIPDNYHSRLDLQWPIYSSGRVDALERAARAEKSAAGEDLTAARADLRLEITRAFWALVTARETERVLARSLDAIDSQVRDLRSRLASGLIAPNDVSSAEAQASRQRVLAIEATNQRFVSDADLRRLTGIQTAGQLDPQVPPPSAAPTDTRTEAQVVDLIATALKTRPERRAFEARALSAEDRAAAVHASALPQLTVGGGFDYARPNPRIFPRSEEWNTSWDVSINASWSLWDGGRRAAEHGEALANARALHARVDDFDRQVTFEVRQRTLQLDSSRAAVTASEDEVRAAAEAERVVGERYRVGVATATDVLDAQVARLQAELDRTRALASVRLAEALLQRALGQ